MENKNKESGYTMVELLLVMVVGSIVLAGTYASYLVIANQYGKISSYAEIQSAGLPTLRLVSRDLRMAGHVALDDDMESAFGAINTPVNITDSGNACCDQVDIIYDLDTATRQRVIYYVAPRNNPTRNALFMDMDTWAGGAWVDAVTGAVVVDYVEDFQVVGSDINAGDPMLVDLSLVLRAKHPIAELSIYQKAAYDVGNYIFAITDYYFRDEFNATVNIRNLR